MEYRKIALIGAGAVGAYFIDGLSEMEGISFCVVAEGERKERLEKEGICINEKIFHPQIKTAQEAKGADLILVCTKYQGLSSAVDLVEQMVEEHTVVVSLLNGIDSEEILAERIGEKHLLYSVMRISSERREGKIRYNRETTIGVTVGEKDTKEITPRVQAFVDLLKKADLHVVALEDIVFDQWSKYVSNIIFNLPQAALNVGFGAYYASDNLGAIRDRMFEEVCAVAEAEGIGKLPMADWRKAAGPSARFSTLQDLDAGRQTEVDMFILPLVKLAKKHGLSVPFCECIYYAIKTIEEKNAKIIE